jgi:hypothetical protein
MELKEQSKRFDSIAPGDLVTIFNKRGTKVVNVTKVRDFDIYADGKRFSKRTGHGLNRYRHNLLLGKTSAKEFADHQAKWANRWKEYQDYELGLQSIIAPSGSSVRGSEEDLPKQVSTPNRTGIQTGKMHLVKR